MTATTDRPARPGTAAAETDRKRTAKVLRILGALLMAAGLVLTVSGVASWTLVQTSLADEKITVADDAARFAGEPVDGPLTAYYQADVIEKHALEGAGGRTYAQLDREDPLRPMVMNGSFLRASLFTSIVSFGVAALAMGLGILFAAVGYAVRRLAGTV